MKLISIIVPCLNEQEVIPIFYRTVTEVLDSLENAEYELLFVDDGSDDRTLKVLKELKKKDRRCRYLSFTRNFGKEAAIYAGLTHAKGDYVGLMDVDLQDPPKFLGEMYRTLETGEYDCVAARRTDRAGERRIRSFFSAMFYKVINKISKIEFVEGARDYRLMTRKMRDAVLKMGEYNRFSKGLFSWVGFRTKWLSYHNVERAAGETKWSFGKLLRYSLDGIMGFSTLPLSPVFLRWNFFLWGCVPDNPVFGCQVSDLARPGAGLDYSDVCYASDQWCAASVRGDSGAISGPDLSGGEESAGLSAKRDG